VKKTPNILFLDLTGRVCEAVADYQFQNVRKLTYDYQAGRFDVAFPPQSGRAENEGRAGTF
jgi:hypothetical protein